MIVEHEVIEQTEAESDGRALAWVCDLIRRLGREDPMIVIQAMVGAGYLTLTDAEGRALPTWRCAEVFRVGSADVSLRVHATSLGSQWVHG